MEKYQSKNKTSLFTILLLYLSTFISIYLVYDWYHTRQQYHCEKQIQSFNYQSFDNYGQFLQKQLQQLKDPLEVSDILKYKHKISKINWLDWDAQIKKFQISMGLLLKQLDGVGTKFVSTLGLRNNVNKQIQLYDLCRHKIRGQNRDVSQKCENLLSVRNNYKDTLHKAQIQIRSLQEKKNELIRNEQKKIEELTNLELRYKKIEQQLDQNEQNANQRLQRLQLDLQTKKNSQLLVYKKQEQQIEEELFRVKTQRQSLSEKLQNTRIRLQQQIRKRDSLKQKIQSLELKSNYDAQLQKLLPSKESIAKAMQLEKLIQKKFNINIKIMSNKKGTNGYQQQKQYVEKLKAQFKQIKVFLSKINQTILSFDLNFKRQQNAAWSQLQLSNQILQQLILEQTIYQQKIITIQSQISSVQNQKTKLRYLITALKQQKPIQNDEIQEKLRQKIQQLMKVSSEIKISIDKAQGELKNIEIEKDSELKQWQQAYKKYSQQSAEINKKTKQIETEIQKMLKLLNSNLSECKNRRKFIESIEQRAASYLVEADDYYREIQKSKKELKEIINRLYLNL